MKIIRPGSILAILAALVVAGTLCLRQQMQINGLKESLGRIATKYQELSDKYAALSAVAEARNGENARLHSETAETLRLRNQLAQLRRQLAAETENRVTKAESSTDFVGYLRKEQLRFVGFDSPESAFQSMRWASLNGDYTNWVAALAPRLQEEELANPRSVEEFQRASALEARIQGMQVLAAKPVGSDRMELKVRLDTESFAAILLFPMVAVGNEWRLGDEIRSYTEAWDRPGDAQ